MNDALNRNESKWDEKYVMGIKGTMIKNKGERENILTYIEKMNIKGGRHNRERKGNTFSIVG